MSSYGTVALKMRYLGGTFAGQDLCRARIDVCENAISVHVWRAHQLRRDKFIDDPAKVALLKAKLRVALARMKTKGRWKWTKIRPGTVYIEIFYPSRSWLSSTGQCRLFSSEGTF
jgi:hypothetical protein